MRLKVEYCVSSDLLCAGGSYSNNQPQELGEPAYTTKQIDIATQSQGWSEVQYATISGFELSIKIWLQRNKSGST